MILNPPDVSVLLSRGLLPGLFGVLLFVAGLGLQAEAMQVWHVTLIMAVVALIAWTFAYRRYRQYADTPSAPISSAPQGYIAISGIGRPLPGEPLLSPFNYLPCLWYRMLVETRDSDGQWQKESDETSDASFILEGPDGTRCTIDPEGASIETLHKDETRIEDRRTTQWLLIAGTRLYAMGNFVTRRPADDRPSINIEVRDKIADWKETGDTRKFDSNGDGELSLDEWEQVREAARQEVEQERQAAADFPDYHTLSAPEDGRPFVISDHDPQQVARRYHWQARIILVLFFLALSVTGWMASHP